MLTVLYILSIPIFGIVFNIIILFYFQSDNIYSISILIFLFYFTNFRLTNWKFFTNTHLERIRWMCLQSLFKYHKTAFFTNMGISTYLTTKTIIQKKIKDKRVRDRLLIIISNPEFIFYFKSNFSEHIYYKDYLNYEDKEYWFDKIGTEILAIVLNENHDSIFKHKLTNIIFVGANEKTGI